MGSRQKQVIYFCEGETEKKLLAFLKYEEKIMAGKVRKFNLWQSHFSKIERTVNKTDELFFVIDTDAVKDSDIFTNNTKKLKPYKLCFIVQNKNLEDELCFSCNKDSNQKLFYDFYQITSPAKFKTKFIKDKNLPQTLDKNNFDFKRLWSRGDDDFADFLNKNQIKVSVNCKYKK